MFQHEDSISLQSILSFSYNPPKKQTTMSIGAAERVELVEKVPVLYCGINLTKGE